MNQSSLPHEMLPGRFGSVIKGVAHTTQAPIEMVGAVALAAATLAVQGNCTVTSKPGLEGPVSLYFMNVCESGERKSAVQTLLFKAANEVQREWADAAAQQADSFSVEHAVWKEKQNAIRTKFKRAVCKQEPAGDIEHQLSSILKEEPKASKVRKLIYQDVTPESLLLGLHEYGNSAALVNDEFGCFVNGPLSRQLPLLNSMWSGVESSVDRKTSGSFLLKNPRLTCLFQAQPAVFHQFLERQGKQARGNGFLARVLVSYPISTQGTRFEDGQERHCPDLDWFYERWKTLINRSEKRTLKFTPQAQHEWYEIFNLYEVNSQPVKCNADIRDFASKAAEQIARIAAVMHAFMTDDNDEISSETLTASINLVEWYRVQFLQVVTHNDPAAEFQSDFNLFFTWVKSAILNNNCMPIAYSYISQFGPYRLRKQSKMKPLMETLVGAGLLVLLQNGRHKTVGLPRPTFRSNSYNPSVGLMS